MTSSTALPVSWPERAADESRAVQRARARQTKQAQAVIDAGRRLIAERGEEFTTQELVKEAGVALQTFYRLFVSKDRLLLAILETMIADYSDQLDEVVRPLPDPVERLRFIVTSAVRSVDASEPGDARFVTAQHWRLAQLFPEEISRATQPFSDLVAKHLHAAATDELLAPRDVERDAWFVTQLVMAVFHHSAFADAPEDPDVIGERLWSFCRAALDVQTHPRIRQGGSP